MYFNVLWLVHIIRYPHVLMHELTRTDTPNDSL